MSNEVTVRAGIKPWFQSKIVRFSLAGVTVFLGSFVVSIGVTPEEMASVQNAYPKIAQAIQDFQRTKDYIGLFGALLSATIGIIRVWYTTALMPQSIPKE